MRDVGLRKQPAKIAVIYVQGFLLKLILVWEKLKSIPFPDKTIASDCKPDLSVTTQKSLPSSPILVFAVSTSAHSGIMVATLVLLSSVRCRRHF